MKQPLYTAILIVAGLAFSSAIACFSAISWAQDSAINEFKSDQFGISVSYSAPLVPASPLPGVVLLLRPPNQRYPSFNIIAVPGSTTLDRSAIPERKQELLLSYARVGLEGVRITDASQWMARDGGERITLAIEYGLDPPLRSSVTWANGQDKYFILTFISAAADYNESNDAAGAATLDRLTRDSFTVHLPNELPIKRGRKMSLWLLLALGLAVGFAAWWLWKRIERHESEAA